MRAVVIVSNNLPIPLSEQRYSWNSDCVYKIPGCRSGLNILKPKRPVSLAVITASACGQYGTAPGLEP
jgi:hypothetical protein